ncbi:hypothetical protein CAEBREN_16438 [Caenorhabditis brenneri]|uniref:Uncharacterized protein n=1 Tax=Caenorhabditis brenneri TaxID=135651 RepID=G0MUB7_CAEBE|nr:hypothetical protein CAEBREN_16438 [Caenorhabditis brenneri]
MMDINEATDFCTKFVLFPIAFILFAVIILIFKFHFDKLKLEKYDVERPNNLFINVERRSSWFNFNRSSPRGSIPKIIISPEAVLPEYKDLEGASPLPSYHEVMQQRNDPNHLKLPPRI